MSLCILVIQMTLEIMPKSKTYGQLKKGRDPNAPVLCFAGHTDVVPIGDESAWKFPPFSATVHEGKLYGRGASDMKTGIASFVIAAENFIKNHPNHTGSIAMLITADEEGPAINGTIKVAQTLKERGQKIDFCLVGEPSSTQSLGDVIKKWSARLFKCQTDCHRQRTYRLPPFGNQSHSCSLSCTR